MNKYENLKRYFIFDIRDLDYEEGDYVFLEKVKYQDINKCLVNNYLYSYWDGELLNKNGNFRLFDDDPIGLIKYESDSLQDCIDNLLLVTNSEKYNL